MSRGRSLVAAGLGVVLLGLAAPAWAAEGDPVFSPLGTALRWLNTAIVFGGAAYLLWNRAPRFFRGRAETIAESIGAAARVREQAEARQREAEEKLERLDEEVAALRVTAQRESEAETERIRELARAEAERIERAAAAEIEAAERAARMELKAMAARQAVARAEELIRRRLSGESHAALVHSFTEELRRTAR